MTDWKAATEAARKQLMRRRGCMLQNPGEGPCLSDEESPCGCWLSTEQFLSDIIDALKAHGFVVVPEKPSARMIKACAVALKKYRIVGQDSDIAKRISHGTTNPGEKARIRYAAMIKAAQADME